MSLWKNLPRSAKYIILAGAGAGVAASVAYYAYLSLKLSLRRQVSDQSKGDSNKTDVVNEQSSFHDGTCLEESIAKNTEIPVIFSTAKALDHITDRDEQQSNIFSGTEKVETERLTKHVAPYEDDVDTALFFIQNRNLALIHTDSEQDLALDESIDAPKQRCVPSETSDSTFGDLDPGFAGTGKIEHKVLVLGLDRSGKSGLLARLSKEVSTADEVYHPTSGFNIVCISNPDRELSIWEIGGVATIRDYWHNFLAGTSLVLFVVDPTDEDRLDEARSYLHQVVERTPLSVPVLVVLSKSDLVTPTAKGEAVAQLELDTLRHKWFVFSVSVTDSDSARNGIEELQKFMMDLLKEM